MLRIGDVIQSEIFAYGVKDRLMDGKPTDEIRIALGEKSHKTHFSRSEEERLVETAKTGVIPTKDYILDLAVYDESRGKAKFVVIEAEENCGDSREGIPSCFEIKAKRLRENDDYDPKGEIIWFCLLEYPASVGNSHFEEKMIKVVGQKKIVITIE
ncbi:MAG: hypothetical protein PHX34_02485 [Candidatus Shapirobacteria bacterium]|nr:hypothetical protein [Candidatus Shapirobacteria bacterium]